MRLGRVLGELAVNSFEGGTNIREKPSKVFVDDGGWTGDALCVGTGAPLSRKHGQIARMSG
jgi:hypothetical protein